MLNRNVSSCSASGKEGLEFHCTISFGGDFFPPAAFHSKKAQGRNRGHRLMEFKKLPPCVQQEREKPETELREQNLPNNTCRSISMRKFEVII